MLDLLPIDQLRERGGCDRRIRVLTLVLSDQNGISCALLSKVGLVSSEGALSCAHGGTTGLVGVCTALKVIFSREVGTDRLRGGLKAECRGSGGEIRWILRPISLLFLLLELFLGDQIIDAFLVLNHA